MGSRVDVTIALDRRFPIRTTRMHGDHRPTNVRDSFIHNIGWILKLVWRSGPTLTVANAALATLQSLLPIAGLYLLKLVIDGVSTAMNSADRSAALRHVELFILLSLAVLVVDRAAGILLELVRNAQSLIVVDRVYDILHAKSTEVDLEYYENSEYYDALHRAQSEAPYRPTRILDYAFSIGQSSISVIALGGLLLALHWSVPVLLMVAAVPDLLMKFYFARRLYSWSRQRTPAERQALYFTSVLTGDMHAKEIRLFDLGRVFVERFGRLRQQIREERMDLLRK